MDSLTLANSVAQPVFDATSDGSSAATFVSPARSDDASEPSEQQVSLATSAFDPYNSIFGTQVSSLVGDDESGPTSVFSQARTTLAYSNQDNASGTTLTTGDSSDTSNLALLGQYMASNVALWSAGSIGGMAANETLSIASNTASGTGVNGDVANPAPTGVPNVDNSSASPVMLSAAVEQAPPEITAGVMWAYDMSDSAFAVATAMPDPAASSGGTAFAVITSTTSNSAPPASGDRFVAVAGDLVATNGGTAGSVTTPGTGTLNGLTDLTINAALPSPNTWQQDVALMSNYLASTFPMPAVGDGFANSAASSAPPAQDALAAPVLANHQNSV